MPNEGPGTAALAATALEAAGGHPPEQFLAYVPRLALEWLSHAPGEQYRRVDGTLVFVDVSGFTALTERLAARGRAGTEEINEIVSSTFGELAGIAGRYGADLLKWGGDAAVLLFDGPGSAARATRAAWLMTRAMRRLGRLRTSVGKIELRVSAGAHSGAFDLFLLGEHHRELIVAGPGATRTVEMENLASAGEVVVSDATAALLDPNILGATRGNGVLLTAEPRAGERPPQLPLGSENVDAGLLVPERARRHLLSGDEQAEHRPITVGFVQLSGLDGLIERCGPAAAAEQLGPVVRAAQEASERHRISFHGTDLAAGGAKILLLGGVPQLEGDDTDRVLRTALEIVRPFPGGPALSVRAGVNMGNAFVFSALPLGRRRVYSVTGDAVNLAARVVEAAAPGELLCTEAARAALRAPFSLRQLPPFKAKGKSEPVVSYAVSEESATPVPVAQNQHGFVGRREELGAVLSAIAEVSTGGGTGKVVEIVGPAGIGKSRLVAEALTAWPLVVFRVSCDAFSGGRPYRPLRAAGRQLLGLDDNTPSARVGEVLVATLEEKTPALLPWAPLLGDVMDITLAPTREVDELDPRFRQRRLEAAFIELAEGLLDGPAAFVFEDTHTLDEASASLVTRVARQAELSPWLVVGSRRPEGAGWDALTGRLLIELGALDRTSSEHLVAELAIVTLRPQERQALVERAGGNPLFLVQLARVADASASTESLPDALEPLLAARVDRLSPKDRRLLRTAAVLGLRFEAGLLAEVADDDIALDDDLWRRLSEFVREEEGALLFTHALLRDAAYEGLSFRRRRELHARAATAIEERAKERTGGTDPAVELLSLHWLAAERWERAWECACLAGERAVALYANADAVTQFRRAFGAASHLPQLPAADRARVGELLGDACERAGNYERANAAYTEAYRRLPSGADRTRLSRKTGVLQERQGRYAQALRTYTSAARGLESEDHDALVERCELKLAAAGVHHRQSRLRESTAEAVLAGRDAALAGYRPGLAHSLYLRHINSVYLNEPDDALADEALAIFVELGDLAGQANVLNNLGISAYYRGAWDEALEHYRASRAARERTGDLVGTAREDNNIGEILSDQGHHAEAESCFNTAKSAWQAARYPIGEALATSNLGRLEARRGRTLRGAAMLEEGRTAFEAIRAVSYIDETDLRLAECALLGGETKRGAEMTAALIPRLSGRPDRERLHATALRLHAVALAQLGDGAEAEALLDESITRLRSVAESFELARALTVRAALGRRAGNGNGGGDGGRHGDGEGEGEGEDEGEQVSRDDAEARALFARLGVVSAPAW
jgi:class 3 adenylate cyclase/tetratricopeptide (TPR) repeat protein